MRLVMQTLKKCVFACLFVSSLSFADAVCANLCTSCANKLEDSTCIQTDSLCHCTAVLDSIQKMQDSIAAAENVKRNAVAGSKQLLAYKLMNSCDKEACVRSLYFKDGMFEKIEKGRSPVAKSELINRMKALKSEADISQAEVSPKADNAAVIADSAHVLCDTLGPCIASVVFTSAEMAIINMQVVEEPDEPAQDTVPPPTVPEPAEVVNDTSEADSAQQNTTDSCHKVRQGKFWVTKCEEVPSVAKPAEEKSEEQPSPKKEDIFYTGFALTYGMFEPTYYLGAEGSGTNNREGGFTWLLRWYFYSAGSFQTGLGLFYSYSEYFEDNPEVTLHELTLEFPFTFRLGLPLAKAFAPYAEFSLNVRKPLYGWADMEVEGYRYSTYDWYEYAYDAYRYAGDELSQSDFYSDEDWEFAMWIGGGIEFTRHFAIDFLWLLGEENAGIAREYDSAWRTSLQFAW